MRPRPAVLAARPLGVEAAVLVEAFVSAGLRGFEAAAAAALALERLIGLCVHGALCFADAAAAKGWGVDGRAV